VGKVVAFLAGGHQGGMEEPFLVVVDPCQVVGIDPAFQAVEG
jgi:hypothetical protein